jgi:hypothetical protein
MELRIKESGRQRRSICGKKTLSQLGRIFHRE